MDRMAATREVPQLWGIERSGEDYQDDEGDAERQIVPAAPKFKTPAVQWLRRSAWIAPIGDDLRQGALAPIDPMYGSNDAFPDSVAKQTKAGDGWAPLCSNG
jgi:hypothetical protein